MSRGNCVEGVSVHTGAVSGRPSSPYGNVRAVHILLECILVTTCKRSLGQGNMFTGVCLSTGRLPGPEGSGPGSCLVLGGLVLGGPGPRGGVWSRRVPGEDPPRWLLLECILVIRIF